MVQKFQPVAGLRLVDPKLSPVLCLQPECTHPSGPHRGAEKEDLRLVLPRLFEVAGVSSQDIDAVCTEVENLMGDNAGKPTLGSLCLVNKRY